VAEVGFRAVKAPKAAKGKGKKNKKAMRDRASSLFTALGLSKSASTEGRSSNLFTALGLTKSASTEGRRRRNKRKRAVKAKMARGCPSYSMTCETPEQNPNAGFMENLRRRTQQQQLKKKHGGIGGGEGGGVKVKRVPLPCPVFRAGMYLRAKVKENTTLQNILFFSSPTD
jgi:hypothetical protein